MRVLVVGGGGRENALAWALNRSHGVKQVWVSPGNGGTQELAGCQQLSIAETDHDGLLATCRELGIGFIAYSPRGRGFLTGEIRRFEDFAEDHEEGDEPRGAVVAAAEGG